MSLYQEELNTEKVQGFLSDFIGSSAKAGVEALTTLSVSVVLFFILFFNDSMIGNFSAKCFYLLGFVFQLAIFFSVSHILFKTDDIQEDIFPFQKNNLLSFPCYFLAYTFTYWFLMNFFQYPEKAVLMILYYIVFFSIYIAFMYFSIAQEQKQHFAYYVGSIAFGVFTALGWALLVKSKVIQDTANDNAASEERNKNGIIDIANRPGMTCTAFRL